MAFSRRTSNASRDAALEASRLEAILSFSTRHAQAGLPRNSYVLRLMQQVFYLALREVVVMEKSR